MRYNIYSIDKPRGFNAEETDDHLVIEQCEYQLR
jgi:hypothetical protein